MEHRPWIGRNFAGGIASKKVLIVGFSHWGLPDHPGYTEKVVETWAEGSENAPFCPRIRSYFGDSNPETFWHSVAFANSLPTSVGNEEQRYSTGTPDQIAAIKPRALRLIRELEPDVVFVFSKKAWERWPDYDGDFSNRTLLVENVGEFDAGSYRHGTGETLAFGFNHPQYAPVDATGMAVRAALRATPADLVLR